VTDYDAWKDHPVTAEDVAKIMKANVEKVRSILVEAIPNIPKERKCDCKNALKKALL
jgi:5'-methylthioadenosine phosphorylase